MAEGLDVVALGAACSYTDEIATGLETEINTMKNIGRFLALWNLSTGKPVTDPTGTLPYTYKTGDYYRIGTLAAAGSNSYIPNGTQYTGVASTAVGTDTYTLQDIFFFDGSVWKLQSSSQGEGGAVRYDAPQTLTDAQKTQARTNISACAMQEYDSTAASYAENTFFYVVED